MNHVASSRAQGQKRGGTHVQFSIWPGAAGQPGMGTGPGQVASPQCHQRSKSRLPPLGTDKTKGLAVGSTVAGHAAGTRQ